MLDALTTEVILTVTIIVVSVLSMFGSVMALRATRPKRKKLDIDALIRDAPYHRLPEFRRDGNAKHSASSKRNPKEL